MIDKGARRSLFCVQPVTNSNVDYDATQPSCEPAQGRSPLRRDLNVSSLIALTFFCVAGGAYGLEDAVGAAGPAVVLLSIVVLPWIWSLPTALMTAELSTAMPEDG
ncbi:MAG TPA: hypothetical protein VKR81_00255, partial [Candidatus Binatia bacterium]|nr:hypothetical protein [Candidatus Binatia bacterium]